MVDPRRRTERLSDSESRTPEAGAAQPGMLSRFHFWGPTLALALLGVVTVFCWAQWRYRQWERDRHIGAVLQAVHRRELRFYEANRAFAGDIEALHLNLNTEDRARLNLVAGWIDGKPTYIAEMCYLESCRIMKANGHTQEGIRVDIAVQERKAATLMEGEARRLGPRIQQRRGG